MTEANLSLLKEVGKGVRFETLVVISFYCLEMIYLLGTWFFINKIQQLDYVALVVVILLIWSTFADRALRLDLIVRS